MPKRLIGLFMVLAILISCISCAENEKQAMLELRFLDVGQGDATLLRTSVGDILIDAGTDASQETLCNHLANLGVQSLVLAIFTHSDEDHIGGADGVLRQFPTKTVWISSFFEDGEATNLLRQAANETGAVLIEVGAGKMQAFGDTVLSVLSPYGQIDGAAVNDQSLVIKVSCGETTALFMGDAEFKAEEHLLNAYDRTQFCCDVLKVGHHGASTSSSAHFLNAVKPQYAIISCDEGNYYGHPHGETLARLENVGAEILRTDLLGDIVLYTDGVALWMSEK